MKAVVDITVHQCPNREPDLALGGTHGALPLENPDNPYGVAPPHQTD